MRQSSTIQKSKNPEVAVRSEIKLKAGRNRPVIFRRIPPKERIYFRFARLSSASRFDKIDHTAPLIFANPVYHGRDGVLRNDSDHLYKH